MKKTIITALVLTATAATAQAAPTGYKSCEREIYSRTGFANDAAAQSWYPKRIWIKYSGKTAKSTYGEDEKRTSAEIRNGIAKFPVLNNAQNVMMHMRKDGKTMDVRLMPNAGYKAAGSARYTCK